MNVGVKKEKNKVAIENYFIDQEALVFYAKNT